MTQPGLSMARVNRFRRFVLGHFLEMLLRFFEHIAHGVVYVVVFLLVLAGAARRVIAANVAHWLRLD